MGHLGKIEYTEASGVDADNSFGAKTCVKCTSWRCASWASAANSDAIFAADVADPAAVWIAVGN